MKRLTVIIKNLYSYTREYYNAN